VETSRGGEQTISTAKYEVTGRGGKGRELLQRGEFTRIIASEVENPQPLDGGRKAPPNCPAGYT
jgi:DNA gyrase subunit A